MDLFDTQQPLMERLLAHHPPLVADLGAGLGRHTRFFLDRGCPVIAVDRTLTPDLSIVVREHPGRAHAVRADLTNLPFANDTLPTIWACHCLEHMTDPLSALREWRRVLRPDAMLAVAVPPYKSEVVGRHVFTGWNVGQLMLTLLRAGFAIRHGAYARHAYNIFALVRKDPNPPAIRPNDEILCRYHNLFPPAVEQAILDRRFQNPFGETISSFEGDIERLGW